MSASVTIAAASSEIADQRAASPAPRQRPWIVDFLVAPFRDIDDRVTRNRR